MEIGSMQSENNTRLKLREIYCSFSMTIPNKWLAVGQGNYIKKKEKKKKRGRNDEKVFHSFHVHSVGIFLAIFISERLADSGRTEWRMKERNERGKYCIIQWLCACTRKMIDKVMYTGQANRDFFLRQNSGIAIAIWQRTHYNDW